MMLNGTIYFAFASYCDIGQYQGWVFGYNATDFTQKFVFCDTPYPSPPGPQRGGIWHGGAPIATDGTFLYLVAGNGAYNDPGAFGQSMLKLDPNNVITVGSLTNICPGPTDYFTPFNVALLNDLDLDIGSNGPLLIPGFPDRFLTGGKGGKMYLTSTTNMGKFRASSNSNLQTFNVVPSGNIVLTYGAMTTYNSSTHGLLLYVWAVGDVLRGFRFNTTTKVFNTPSVVSRTNTAPFPGGQLTLSSNGNEPGSAILWALTPGNVLRAYDADDIRRELWSSVMNRTRDEAGSIIAKFNIPTVANGKVYVPSWSTPSRVYIYGLLHPPIPSPSPSPIPSPSLSAPPPIASPSLSVPPVPSSIPSPIPSSIPSPIPSPSSSPPPAFAGIRVNCGGPIYVDSRGMVWEADNGTQNGLISYNTNTIFNTSDPAIYRTKKFQPRGDLVYTFAVTPGVYMLKLHFAETYPGTQAIGKRVFNILINGVSVWTNFDVYAEVGSNTALVKTRVIDLSLNPGPSGSEIEIRMTHVVENPFVCGIEILAAN